MNEVSKRRFRRLPLVILCGAALTFATGRLPAAVRIIFDDSDARAAGALSPTRVMTDSSPDDEVASLAEVNSHSDGEDTSLGTPSFLGHTAGTLTLDFEPPASFVEFRVVILSEDYLKPTSTVELFDSSHTLADIIPLETRPFDSFTEAGFLYEGEPVQRAVIHFDDGSASPIALKHLDAAGAASLPFFARGDVDGDGRVSVGDAAQILNALLLPNRAGVQCADAADADDSGTLDIADAIHVLSYLFQGGRPPPPPFPSCDTDVTPDDLGCESYRTCPVPPNRVPSYCWGMCCFYFSSCRCFLCLDR